MAAELQRVRQQRHRDAHVSCFFDIKCARVSQHLAQDARGFARAVIACQRVGVEALAISLTRVGAQGAKCQAGRHQCRLYRLQAWRARPTCANVFERAARAASASSLVTPK